MATWLLLLTDNGKTGLDANEEIKGGGCCTSVAATK
jgi:hypothetical protein